MGTRKMKVKIEVKKDSAVKRCALFFWNGILDMVIATLSVAMLCGLVYIIFYFAACGWRKGCNTVPENINLNIGEIRFKQDYPKWELDNNHFVVPNQPIAIPCSTNK